MPLYPLLWPHLVEWLNYSKRIIIGKKADLSEFFSLTFVGKMCVFVSRPMKIVTFLRKNGDPAKRVVDFPRERETFRNKIMEIVEDFDENSYNNNGKPWKSSRILRVNPNFFIFFLCPPFFVIFFVFLKNSFFPFFHFFHFFSFCLFFSFSLFFFFSSFLFFHFTLFHFFHLFHFFIFFIFSFFFIFIFSIFSFLFFNFSFFFNFLHFLSFSFIFYHFLSFSFIFSFLSFSFIFSLSFIFFHFLTFSDIFFHVLSFSFIFFHFFVFVGCSKSVFFWVSISSRFLLTVLM